MRPKSFRTTLPVPSHCLPRNVLAVSQPKQKRRPPSRSRQRQGTLSHSEALIARLKLEIDKVRRELYGTRSERKARLVEQMELQLEELEADAGEDELVAEIAAKASTVKAFERRRPSRKPFPEHLPRERVIIAAPANCACCGSAKVSKLGEDITETLEVVPRQWKVIQTVREKFTCRECEKITQPPAPFHVTPRGFAGPNLLAMILFEKVGQHQPLTARASAMPARASTSAYRRWPIRLEHVPRR
jgi:transposase